MSNAFSGAFAAQAAAEYVGVMLSGAVRAVQNGFYAAGRFVEANPAAVIAAVLVLLVLARLARRR